MPYSKRFLLQDSCFVSPVCLAPGLEDGELDISSQKLADRSDLSSITILFVVGDSILHETVEDLPLSRVKVPARLLTSCASITIHLAVCNADGVADAVDSGQLLVLPPGPAKELQQVFQQMTQDVQESFCSPGPDSVQVDRCKQHTWSHLLPQPQQPHPASAATDGAPAAEAGADPQPGSAVAPSRSISPAGARRAVVYAYQHMLLPVVHLMSAVLQGSAAHRDGPSSDREITGLQNIAQRLLDFLVENDMFESAMFFMGQLPFDPIHAMGSRLQLLHSQAGQHSHIRALLLQQPLQQQLLTLQICQQHTAETLREMQRRSNMFPVLNLQEHEQEQQHTSMASLTAAVEASVLLQQRSSSSSIASADDILRQLGALEQARVEQEALESELQLQEEQDALEQQALEMQEQLEQQMGQPGDLAPEDLEQDAAAADHRLHRCSSVPWSFHSMQKGPYQPGLSPGHAGAMVPAPGLPMGYQHVASTEEGLGLPTTDLVGLALGQQQQRHSRAIPEDLEGYLQPHPSLVRRSFPQQAAGEDAFAAGLAGVVRGSSFELGLPHRPALVPMVSQRSARTGADQLDHQHAGTLGAAVAAHGQQLQLHLHLQQQLPAFAQASQQEHYQQLQYVQQVHQQQQLAAALASAQSAAGSTMERGGSSQLQQHQQGTLQLTELGVQQQESASTGKSVGSVSDCSPETHSNSSNSRGVKSDNDSAAAELAVQACCSSSKAAAVDCSETAGLKPQQRHPQVSCIQQLPGLVQVALKGFADPNTEQAYLTFRNHSSWLLDSTAAVMCFGMLIAAAGRSLTPQDPLLWQKAAVIVVYGLAFFFPYAIMRTRQRLFLKFREPMLVGARVLSSLVLILVGLGFVAQPDAWVAAVGTFITLQLQDGFILPCCQQVRMPSAVAIAVAQCAADASMLQLAYPGGIAVLQSIFIHTCALVVGLWLDVWGRRRFMRQYRGMVDQRFA